MTSLLSMPGDTGLDEAGIARVVDHFYERVRADALLGAVFNPVVDDWDAHKQLLTAFWCSVALRAGTYRGNPMAMHRPHPIRAAHFTRWLELWRETTHALLAPEAAATLCAYAGRIGNGLQLGLGLQPAGGRGLGLPLAGAATQP
jgi:hemoglobin